MTSLNKNKKTWKKLMSNPKGLPNQVFSNLSFPGGTFFIDSHINNLINTSTGMLVDNGSLTNFVYAHPIFLFNSTLRGSGASIQDIFDLLDYDVNNGPMLGQCNMSFRSRLLLDKEYKVDGKIVSLIEKESKKLGRIKVLDFTLVLIDEFESKVASVDYIWILPLKEL